MSTDRLCKGLVHLKAPVKLLDFPSRNLLRGSAQIHSWDLYRNHHTIYFWTTFSYHFKSNSSLWHDSWSVTKLIRRVVRQLIQYLHQDWCWPIRGRASLSVSQWEGWTVSRDGHAGHARTGAQSTRHISGLKTPLYCTFITSHETLSRLTFKSIHSEAVQNKLRKIRVNKTKQWVAPNLRLSTLLQCALVLSMH